MPPSPLALRIKKLEQLFRQKIRKVRGIDRRVVTLSPIGPARGRVLLSYIIDPFLLRPGTPPSHAHTHDWESLEMASVLRELGYTVDVISWADDRFEPSTDYDLFIDARYNLERIGDRTGPRTIKVMHADTAHCDVHNAAEERRLDELFRRRGVRLRPRRFMAPNHAVDHADAITVLGNEFTVASYRFAGKPIFRIPISTPVLYPWSDDKDFTVARTRFLWFGSGGLVHKGLDLVLEAFAGAPELELVICGPVEREVDFVSAYRHELYETPNIHLHGWIDIASSEFRSLARTTGALIYPSSSEGGGGSVLTCMHAGVVPIVTAEASVDIDPSYGVLLDDPSVDGIREALRRLAGRPPAELRDMTRAGWEWARANHTRERFSAAYRRLATRLLAGDLDSAP